MAVDADLAMTVRTDDRWDGHPKNVKF